MQQLLLNPIFVMGFAAGVGFALVCGIVILRAMAADHADDASPEHPFGRNGNAPYPRPSVPPSPPLPHLSLRQRAALASSQALHQPRGRDHYASNAEGR